MNETNSKGYCWIEPQQECEKGQNDVFVHQSDIYAPGFRSLAEGEPVEFKMITDDEANIRKLAGVGVGLTTVALYATSGLGYGTLSGGLFAAISTYRTGAESQ